MKIAFSSKSQYRTGRSQENSLLQLCFWLSAYWNNFNCNFFSDLKLLTRKLLSKHCMHNVSGHSIITFALRGEEGSIKMQKHANRGGGEGVMSIWTFTNKFFSFSTWSIRYLQKLPNFSLVSSKYMACLFCLFFMIKRCF